MSPPVAKRPSRPRKRRVEGAGRVTPKGGADQAGQELVAVVEPRRVEPLHPAGAGRREGQPALGGRS